MVIVVIVLLVGAGGLILWGLLAFVRGYGQAIAAPPRNFLQTTDSASDEIDGMNNGDYYNGPYCYSPMTGYSETQYESGFDEAAEWHEEH